MAVDPSVQGSALPVYKILGNRLFSDRTARALSGNQDVQTFEKLLLRTIATHGPLPDALFTFNFYDSPDVCGKIEELHVTDPQEDLAVPCLSYTTTADHLCIPVPFLSHYSQAENPPPLCVARRASLAKEARSALL